eukprot:g12787.t1
MSTSHLYSLRKEKRRERLEWLGDIVLEEIIVRLIARQALAALDREEEEERQKRARGRSEREGVGSGEGVGAVASAGPTEGMETGAEGGFGVPEMFRPLSWRLDFAARLAVSNANLRAVYEDHLVGLMSLVGLEEDQFLLGLSGVGCDGGGGCGGGGKRKRCRSSSSSSTGIAAGQAPSAKKVKTGKDKRLRCRSSSLGSAADATAASPASASTKVNKRDKRMPDMVEAAIGEAFEASLGLGAGVGGKGGRGGGRSGAGVVSEAGPQRFLGGHRAALVDRLLSSALTTEYFLSGLREPRAADRGGGDATTYGEEAEGPYAYDDDLINSSGFANSFGALDGSSSSSDEKDGDETEGAGKKQTTKRQRGVGENEEAPAAQAVPPIDGAAAGADGVNCNESIAAGRDDILRLYGAVLLKFRASVFLFCSAEAAERGGENDAGDGDSGGGKSAESSKHGPFELTLRRQGVLSAENLEAVAEYLLSLRRDGARGPEGRRGVGVANTAAATEGPAAAPAERGGVARHRARDWMRVEVGRAALCDGGSASGDESGLGVAFSTRAAALLLSRSGERGAPPKVKEGAGRGPGGEGHDGPVLVAAGAREAALALAEAQFERDPWPEEDLPRASQQAARLFLSRGVISRGECGAASGAAPSRASSPSAIPSPDSPRDAAAVAAAAAAAVGAARKNKRKREGGEGVFRVPPRYVGLLGQLPRDSRHLLARLGHQGYVKVLEDLLRGFLEASSAAATADTAPAVDTDEVVVPPATADSASNAGVIGDKVDLSVNPQHAPGPLPRDDARYPGNPGSDDGRDGPGQDHPQDPWQALQAGRPHPSLSGLVEPPDLASAGVKRMVLPMPNPFYRRVLHALCRVHGLVSCGGEARRRAEAGDKDGRGRAEAGYRTVEVSRGDGGGGWGSVKRPGGRGGEGSGVKAPTLVPVELLLAER